jgi:O-antigen biosynthesis protein
MLQILEVFREWGWSIEMASTAKATEFSENMGALRIPLHHIQLNHSSFDSFISALNPDAVLFDRFMTEEQFGWRVAEQCPKAIRILDTEDLHGLRAARETALKEKRLFENSDLLNGNAFREIASIWRCDLSLIISEFEMELLCTFFNVQKHLLFYLPFLVKPSEFSQNTPSYSERKHFISLGNFLHEPNVDAVKYLHSALWPNIKKQLPDAELHVYGAYTPDSIKHLHSNTFGFLVKGRAENVNEIMQKARLLLAPLRFGAGLKGKILDAALNATPCISSSIGAEGMSGEFDWPGGISDKANTFVNASVQLYTNEMDWKRASKQCALLLNKFNRDSFVSVFKTRIELLLQELNEVGRKNFTGAMLQHQQLNSSKYMSLWIEAKNKLS